MSCSTVHDGSSIGVLLRTIRVDCRSVWLSSITSTPGGQVGEVAAGAGEPVVGGEQVVDLAGDADPGGDQHDQVVADAFQVGDQVRGQDDAGAVVGDERHQALQELAPGERVEAGHRLVEDQQLGPFRDGQGQRELGALPAGELPGLLRRVQAELARSGRRRAAGPSRG